MQLRFLKVQTLLNNAYKIHNHTNKDKFSYVGYIYTERQKKLIISSEDTH